MFRSHVACATVEGLVPNSDTEMALQDDEGLVVGMMMQPGPWPGWLYTRKNDT